MLQTSLEQTDLSLATGDNICDRAHARNLRVSTNGLGGALPLEVQGHSSCVTYLMLDCLRVK
jgi:hypothetical protein